MSLSTINRNAEIHGNGLENGPIVAVKIEAVQGQTIQVGLLIDSPLGKAGTRFNLVQPASIRGITIGDIATGRPERDGVRAIHRSRPGDILVFDRGLVDGQNLLVGKLATRMHDGLTGPVQAARVYARPGRSSVSKRGAIQFTTLADPGRAIVTADEEQFRAFAAKSFAAWPGGRHGFILRDATNTIEILADEDKVVEPVDDFVTRLIKDNEIFGAGAIEVIPIWSIQMGRDQVVRDVDPKVPTEKPVTGSFGTLYSASGRRGFLPSIAVLTDEDEWAFGGKTGRQIRVIAGMHPLRTDLKILPDTMPTSARNKGAPASPMGLLYKSDAEIAAAQAARAPKADISPAASSAPATSRPAPRAFR